MPDSSAIHCVHCGADERQRSIERCPICFKGYCDEHAHVMSGRRFCSSQCAEYYFFQDPDESEGSVDE